MLVKDFITKDIPVLKSFDTAEYGLGLMDDFKLKHLPLIEDGLYRCLVSKRSCCLYQEVNQLLAKLYYLLHRLQRATTF